ncbi:MAG: septum formation initiator family protein [Deltaproteobacteria bacterium]|nr:septum formation initiator family protein [Deltaproteobacteria bacterium]
MKRLLLGMLLVGALAFWAVNILHPGRAERLRWLEQSRLGLEARTMRLQLDNQRLRDELHALETSAAGWQAAARAEFGMLLPGEVVYRFPPTP